MKNSPEVIRNNLAELADAFDRNEDTDQLGNYKTIFVLKAIWDWSDELDEYEFYEGYAYKSEDYQNNDLKFVCTSIEDVRGGTSSEFSVNFSSFKYSEKDNCMTVTGNKQGRNYSVKVYFG